MGMREIYGSFSRDFCDLKRHKLFQGMLSWDPKGTLEDKYVIRYGQQPI